MKKCVVSTDPNCLMEEVPRIPPENPMDYNYNSQAWCGHESLQIAAATWIGEVRWKLLFYSFLFTTETQNKQKGNLKCNSSPDAGLRLVDKKGATCSLLRMWSLMTINIQKFETVGWNFGPKIVARGTTKILENFGKWKHVDNGLTKRGKFLTSRGCDPSWK